MHFTHAGALTRLVLVGHTFVANNRISLSRKKRENKKGVPRKIDRESNLKSKEKGKFKGCPQKDRKKI